MDQIANRDREAYEIERGLAERLRRSTKQNRARIAREVYGDLYRLVPSHPDLTRSEADRNFGAASQVYSYERWVSAGAAVLEVGAGSCDVIRRLGEKYPSTQFTALDVARDPLESSGKPLPTNVHFVQAGAIDIPFPNATFDFAYCSQVFEHWHPDDAVDHLSEVARILKPGGWFGLDTPNFLTGPHDISRAFTDKPTGLHLKEWTYGEILAALREAGFRAVWTRALPGRLSRSLRLRSPGPLVPARAKSLLEPLLARIGLRSLRQRLASLLLIHDVFVYAKRGDHE